MKACILVLLLAVNAAQGFVSRQPSFVASTTTRLFSTEEKAAPLVSGEKLETMLTEWDEPLVIDAYATW